MAQNDGRLSGVGWTMETIAPENPGAQKPYNDVENMEAVTGQNGDATGTTGMPEAHNPPNDKTPLVAYSEDDR